MTAAVDNDRAADRDPDPKKDLSPPSYITATLAGLAEGTDQVSKKFDEILTMPFINELKVTAVDGSQSSVNAVMLDCKKKYQDLQARTLPIVRDLASYANVQQVSYSSRCSLMSVSCWLMNASTVSDHASRREYSEPPDLG